MGEKKGVVIAVGGNAITKDKGKVAIKDQEEVIKETCGYIADLVEDGYSPVVAHGNGPQVGFLLRRAEIAESPELPIIPIYALSADTQGATGFMFTKSLTEIFAQRDINSKSVALVTQSIVDKNDPAFEEPTKPIGTFMDEENAKRHEVEDGWDVREDSGRGWRRVIASPAPQEIVEVDAITTLMEAGYVVIAAGGGGIPVVREGEKLVGVEAVIDKDLAAALLAQQLGCEDFVICTAVERVALKYGKPDQEDISSLTVEEAETYIAAGEFGKGSMEPKVQAAINFIKGGGKRVIITSLERLQEAIRGEAGTIITA